MSEQTEKEPIRYLTATEAAEHLGLHSGTWVSYQARGTGPQPDAIVGRVRGWLPETVDEWQRQRREKRPVD